MLLSLSFEGKTQLSVVKFCMIRYPPTPDKLLAAQKFGCAVSRAPGPAEFYCHSAQLMWFNEDHDLIPTREADYLLLQEEEYFTRDM